MARKNRIEVVESKTPAEFFSEHQSICGFDNVSCFKATGICRLIGVDNFALMNVSVFII